MIFTLWWKQNSCGAQQHNESGGRKKNKTLASTTQVFQTTGDIEIITDLPTRLLVRKFKHAQNIKIKLLLDFD
jgi:hypothetical protein